MDKGWVNSLQTKLTSSLHTVRGRVADVLAPTPSQAHRSRLRRFYAQHNPDKLPEVDSILQSAAGNEAELFVTLHRKYQVPFEEEDYRYLVWKFYRKYNPAKLRELDALMRTYQGRMEDLFRDMKQKYDAAADEEFQLIPPRAEPAAAADAAPAGDAPAPAAPSPPAHPAKPDKPEQVRQSGKPASASSKPARSSRTRGSSALPFPMAMSDLPSMTTLSNMLLNPVLDKIREHTEIAPTVASAADIPGGELAVRHEEQLVHMRTQHVTVLRSCKALDRAATAAREALAKETSAWQGMEAQLAAVPALKDQVLATKATVQRAAEQMDLVHQLMREVLLMREQAALDAWEDVQWRKVKAYESSKRIELQTLRGRTASLTLPAAGAETTDAASALDSIVPPAETEGAAQAAADGVGADGRAAGGDDDRQPGVKAEAAPPAADAVPPASEAAAEPEDDTATE